MNFLFDLSASQPNIDGDFHGGGKYTKKIFLTLLKEKDNNRWTIFGLYNSALPLDDEIKEQSENCNIKLLDLKLKSLKEILVEFSIKRFYSALPFNIHFDMADVLGSGCEAFGTIHGLRPFEVGLSLHALSYSVKLKEKIKILAKICLRNALIKKEYKQFSRLFSKMKIMTVSYHTKYSIMSYFPSVTEDIEVYYSPDVTEFEDTTNDTGVTDFNQSNYFLMVSGNRWLKNNLRSVMALDELFSERKDITQNVIVTGVTHPEVYLQRLKNKKRFTFYKYVSENHLRNLYGSAFAFIYMTLNEGFGYPPLEAMKSGVPTITSPFTSLTEICGNSVLYSNPYSKGEIKNRVLQLLNKPIYDEFVKKGLKQYAYIREKQDVDLLKMTKLLLN